MKTQSRVVNFMNTTPFTTLSWGTWERSSWMSLTEEERHDLLLARGSLLVAKEELGVVERVLNQVLEVVPPPPPPPPPPPGGDSVIYPPDWKVLTGFWQGWRGRSLERFTSEADFGRMGTNTQAARRLFDNPTPRGWLSCDIYFETDILPSGGGKHIITVSSTSGQPGWLRPDAKPHLDDTDPTIGNWKFDTYNSNALSLPWYLKGGVRLDIVCNTWYTGQIIRVKTWSPFRITWNRVAPDRFELGFNGEVTSFEISPASVNPYKVVVGNADDIDRFGGSPWIRFRNFRWGAS